MYECIVYLNYTDICSVRLKSITQVCKFLETVNFSICSVEVFTPRYNKLDPFDILSIWRS